MIHQCALNKNHIGLQGCSVRLFGRVGKFLGRSDSKSFPTSYQHSKPNKTKSFLLPMSHKMSKLKQKTDNPQPSLSLSLFFFTSPKSFVHAFLHKELESALNSFFFNSMLHHDSNDSQFFFISRGDFELQNPRLKHVSHFFFYPNFATHGF